MANFLTVEDSLRLAAGDLQYLISFTFSHSLQNTGAIETLLAALVSYRISGSFQLEKRFNLV